MITLEKEHIDHLYSFVRKHFVPWFDLQTELVDHLASGIEQLSEQYPEKTFEQLLELEFKKFGVHGFEDVVEKRRKALSKEYYKMVLNRVISYFKWPVILQSLFFVVFCYFTFVLINPKWLPHIIYGSLFAVGITGYVLMWKQKKSREKKEFRKWLLQDVILNGGGSAGFLFYIYGYFANFFLDALIDTPGLFWSRFLLALSYVLILRVFQVICWVIPKQLESILEERYKTYKFSD